MNFRSPLEATVAALVILVGLLIGGMFAVLTRASNQATAQSVVATTTNLSPAPPAARISAQATATPTLAARPAAKAAVPATPTPAVAVATPTPVAAVAVAHPIVAPTAVPRTAAPAATTAVAAALQPGLWRISEANLQVGTIVWSGAGVTSGGSIAFDVHKERVDGHRVSACERETTLHTVLTAGSAPQTVPYREVNCSGATSTGEVRVSSFSNDGHAFSGSFWNGGSKLGDFTASR